MLCLMAMCDGEDSLQFFTELYMRYKPVLFREASKFTDDFNIVEDLIYTVRNTSISFIRKKARESGRLVSMDESYEAACVTDNAPLPEEVVIMDEKKRDFLKVWDTLPDDTRELLAGKYILRMSDAELAEEFGCSPDSIRMKLTRARRKALEMIKEGGFCFDPA